MGNRLQMKLGYQIDEQGLIKGRRLCLDKFLIFLMYFNFISFNLFK